MIDIFFALSESVSLEHSACAVWSMPALGAFNFLRDTKKPDTRKIGSITPLLRIPSVPAFSLALAAPEQFAPLLFSAANKPLAVCAWRVLGAAVPWNLYPLKSKKRNLHRRIVCCFMAALAVFASAASRKRNEREGVDIRIQIGDELLTFPLSL